MLVDLLSRRSFRCSDARRRMKIHHPHGVLDVRVSQKWMLVRLPGLMTVRNSGSYGLRGNRMEDLVIHMLHVLSAILITLSLSRDRHLGWLRPCHS